MSNRGRVIVRLLVVGSIPSALGACTLAGTVPSSPGPPSIEREPAPTRGVASAPEGTDGGGDVTAAAERITSDVVRLALDAIGTPYRWGGTDANGFDCSGLIQFAYGELGIRLPRRSTAQMRAGMPVRPDPALLRPGDVLGFSADRSGRTSHVGLYIGDDAFIHSSSSGVRVSTLREPYWLRSLVAVRRIVE